MESDVREPIKVGDYLQVRRGSVTAHWCEVVAISECGSHLVYTGQGRLDTHLFFEPMLREYASASDVYNMAGSVFDRSGIKPSKYGTIDEVAAVLLQAAMTSSHSQPWRPFVSFLEGNYSGAGIQYDGLCEADRALAIFKPEKVEGSSAIRLYLNAKDAKRERRTTMKGGRAFKHMFNHLSDKEIAALAEAWIEESSPREFVLKVGGERKDFRKAYCGVRAKYRNPVTTSYRKSLATSCMHTTKVDDGCKNMSPAEVYASGDFKIAWLETLEGHVAARVVFSARVGTRSYHAPIYGACEQSLDMLDTYLQDNKVELSSDLGEWHGLKLLNIESNGRTVGPYMDGCIRGNASGDHIVLSHSGDLDFDSTDGYASDGEMCAHCGDSVHEDELYHTDDGGLCEHCFNENYAYTESGDVIPAENAVYAMTYHSWSRRAYEICVHIDDAVFCEDLDQYWVEEDITWSECGDYAIPTHLMKDYPEYFPSEFEDDDDDETTNNNNIEEEAA